MNDKNTYIYDYGENDQSRLKTLNNVYNPTSQEILLRTEIKNARCIIDLACGQGDMTLWLARTCPESEIIGIDISSEQLNLAQKKIEKHKLSNVKFFQCSVFDLDSKKIHEITQKTPDFIYCRWLLIHLEKDKITPAIKNIYNLLESGGKILHEEVTLKESLDTDSSESFREYIELFTKLALKMNIDFNFGSSLSHYAQKIGYQKTEIFVSKPVFNSEQKHFFALDLISAIPALVNHNIATEQYIYQLCKRIDAETTMTMVNRLMCGVK